jgi:hypothetical protein
VPLGSALQLRISLGSENKEESMRKGNRKIIKRMRNNEKGSMKEMK